MPCSRLPAKWKYEAGGDPGVSGGLHEPRRAGEAGGGGDRVNPVGEGPREICSDIPGPLSLRTLQLLRSSRSPAAALPRPKPPGAIPPGPADRLRAALQGSRRGVEPGEPTDAAVDRSGTATRGLPRPEVLRR